MIDDLTKYSHERGVKIVDADLPTDKLKGLYCDHLIIMQKGLSRIEYGEVLAEELGHYETSFGNILDQDEQANIKQEERAKFWANSKLISPYRIIEAFHARISGSHELAEFLDVSVEFLDETIQRYKAKYGQYIKVDAYIIYFEPLGVMKIL